ncbi:MAG: hypothetical protein GTO02_13695, partial [Candidatus Dadabacteria bacterium]|nr:hypothetical protein [Candidatus Dadabacteria bacterium]
INPKIKVRGNTIIRADKTILDKPKSFSKILLSKGAIRYKFPMEINPMTTSRRPNIKRGALTRSKNLFITKLPSAIPERKITSIP